MEAPVRHKVHIDEIPAAGLTVCLDLEDRGFAELIGEALDGERPRRCTADVGVSKREQRVTLDGLLALDLDLPCARCLEPVEVSVSRDLHAVLLLQHADAEGEVELADEQLDESYLDGDVIDLPELIREQVLLSLPHKPLCSEQCKGLCPGCGADLNHEECTCEGPPLDPRLAPLADLKIDRDN